MALWQPKFRKLSFWAEGWLALRPPGSWPCRDSLARCTRCARRASNPGTSTKQTAAHKTGYLAELVCSNSLKSEQPNSAPWLQKEELRRLDSLLLRIAAEVAVPAGHALAVDREHFAARVTAAVEAHPLVTIRREEVREIPALRPRHCRHRAAD